MGNLLNNAVMVLLAISIYVHLSSFFKKVNPVSYKVVLPEKLEGPFEVNKLLENAERIHENIVLGPESFSEYKGKLYTGLLDGRIVQVTGKEIIPVCYTGNPCQGQHEEHICGRPLGTVFNKDGLLFVVDAYLGLLSVDVKTGEKSQLLSPNTLVDDAPVTFLNSLALDEVEETIYMTQTSTRWNLSSFMVGILEHDTSGRVLKFDLKTRKASVLLTGLGFANGIALTNDNNALLVSEVLKNRIFKYYIKGEKKGKLLDILPNLPGEPDNIKRTSRGTYWTSIANPRTEDAPTLFDNLGDKPLVRSFMIHIHRLLFDPICIIMDLIPSKEVKDLSHELRYGRLIAKSSSSFGMIVEFTEDGKVLRSLHARAGNVFDITEAFEFGGYLYLASWKNNYIGRIKM